MIQLNINKLPEKIVLTIPLDCDTKVMGLLAPLSASTESIDYSNLTDFITGTTTSKLSFIKKSFAPNDFAVGKNVVIRGTNIKAVVTADDTEYKSYRMYLVNDYNAQGATDEYEYPSIWYEEKNGITTYKYKVPKDTGYSADTAFILQHLGIIDEPNIDTNLFINRGINNVFESFKRLKTVTNIQELEKTGFGFFKLYNGGIN